LESAGAIASLVRGGSELCRCTLLGGQKSTVTRKKWPSRASVFYGGVSAPGREAKQGGARPEAKRLAIHRFWGVADSRKED